MKTRRILSLLFALSLTTALTACDNKQEQYEKYISRGDTYYTAQEYKKARLEYKNAAKIIPIDPRAIYHLGQVEEAEGNLHSAMAAYLTAEQQDGNFVPVLIKLSEIYLTAQQIDAVQSRIDKVLAQEPNNARALAILASAHLKQGMADKAQQEVDHALKNNPSELLAYSVQVGIYASRKEMDKALDVIKQAITNNPDEISLYLLKAALYSEKEDFDSVETTYHEIFAHWPHEISYRFDLAKILIELGKKDKVEALYRETIQLFPDNMPAKYQLATFLENEKGVETAEQEINSFIKGEPDQRVFYLWLADLYSKHEDTEKAISVLKKILDNNPDDWLGLNASTYLAKIQMNKGDADLAHRLIDSVLQKDVNNSEAMLLRANLAFMQRDYQGAIADLRTILRNEPGALKASRILAEALVLQNHIDLALDTLLQAVNAHPEDMATQVRTAQLYALRNNPDKAREVLERTTKINPAYALAWETIARLATEQHNWDDAENAIDKLKQIKGSETTALFLSGLLNKESGKKEKAIDTFEQIIKQDPSSALASHALTAIVETIQNKEDMTKARDFLQSLNAASPLVSTVIGGIEMTMGDLDAAQNSFVKAINEKPENQGPYTSLAKLLVQRGQPDKALLTLERAEKDIPSEISAISLRADILAEQGRINDAAAAYEKVLAYNPDAPAAANNYAQLLADYRADDPESLNKARLLAERFINADNPAFLDTLGWVYTQMNMTTQAQPILEKAVSLLKKPNNQIDYHYGALLVKLGRKEEGKTYLMRATASGEKFPGDDKAKELLDTLK